MCIRKIMILLWPVIMGYWCYGFVLLSSSSAAAGTGSGQLFDVGTGHSYDLESTLLLNEAGRTNVGKTVGFQVTAAVLVGTVWQNAADINDKLIRIELTEPKLHIKSRKAPAPEGFIEHTSKFEEMQNSPYLIHWNKGNIQNIYIPEEELLSMVNLKRGVASLFQFQTMDVEQVEKDASGKCNVSYRSVDPRNFVKTKWNCVSGKSVPFIKHPSKIFDASVTSKREIKYELSKDLSVLKSVTAEEVHEMVVVIRQDAGGLISSTQKLTLTDTPVKVLPVNSDSLDNALKELEKTAGLTYKKYILVSDRETALCQDDCPSLVKLVKENHEHLKEENLGTTRSATAFTKLLHAARSAKKEEITKILKSSKNEQIVLQLCDLVGTAQTLNAHEGAMKVLKLDSDDGQDKIERYLWSLSLGSHPHLQVIKDLLKQSEKDIQNEKVAETLVLTVAAMANRYTKLPGNEKHKIIEDVRKSLESRLSVCKTEECNLKYLRAFKNLALDETIPTLLNYSLTGSRKSSVAAMKAIRSFPSSSWTDDVKKAAEQIYFQLKRRFDSSARTLALDIILESQPSKELLRELLLSLTNRDPAYEVKQYLVQRLRQLGESDSDLQKTVLDIIEEEKTRLKNYHIQAQRGLTTAFTRSFLEGDNVNGSLVTIQEVSGGLLKRGIVDIMLEHSGDTQNVFRMGLFAGGLSSFVSSDDEALDPEELEESATAGMEISALDVQIRPFVFFSSQSELMGMAFAGTASSKTPAFQVLTLLQDHLQYIPLQSGFVSELSLIGAVSFDLSGQIQVSLWSRNAHSLVEQNAGISLQGLMKVDTTFVRSQVEFNIGTEVTLNLVSDIRFSGDVALCMQLSQPEAKVKKYIHKVERIPGSKHRLRKSKYKVTRVPGRTYALNRKNNEMCAVILED